MAEMPDPILEGSGRNPREEGVGASSAAAMEGESRPEDEMLMEEVVESRNLIKAYRRVVRNKGAAGIDGMTVEELKPYLDWTLSLTLGSRIPAMGFDRDGMHIKRY